MEELGYFPEVYYRELPPEMPIDYMVRAKEIGQQGRKSLEAFISDDNYQYIQKNMCRLTEKQKENVSLRYILGYVTGLENALKNDRLVDVRRYNNTQAYLKSFNTCRQRMEEIFNVKKEPREGQMSIFDFI